MAIDRADWHYGGDYPKDLPPENGGTHIGMFIAWIAMQNLFSQDLQEDSGEDIQGLRERRITGRDFLVSVCDEKFINDDLTDEARRFVADYYDSEALFAKRCKDYLQDYCEVFNAHAERNGFEYASTYHVENTWDNFDRLAPVIQQRFEEWREWSVRPENQQQDPKDVLLKAVNAIGNAVLIPNGFKPSRKGLTWKRNSADKRLVFEVRFGAESGNRRGKVQIAASYEIQSKKAFQWPAEWDVQLSELRVVGESLNSLERDRDPKQKAPHAVWDAADAGFEGAVDRLSQLISQRVRPIFEKFDDSWRGAQALADDLGFCHAAKAPIPQALGFLLASGTLVQAQAYFDAWYARQYLLMRKQVRKTWVHLATGARDMDDHYAGVREVSAAFRAGLQLPQSIGQDAEGG